MTKIPKPPEAPPGDGSVADPIDRLMRGIAARIEEALLDGVPAETASLTALAMVARALHAVAGPARAAEHIQQMVGIVAAEQEARH
jgi:hypothetical protein